MWLGNWYGKLFAFEAIIYFIVQVCNVLEVGNVMVTAIGKRDQQKRAREL